jgi:hypothetical protein
MIKTLYTKPGLEGRHPVGIPEYAVDRHNRRGKGADSQSIFKYGEDTTDFIRVGAEQWNVDISTWSKQEIAKSHGPGRRSFVHQKMGVPTLISQFFKEGSAVHAESLIFKDQVRKAK